MRGYTEAASEGARVCVNHIAYRFDDGTDWSEVVAEIDGNEGAFCDKSLRENGVIP